MGYTSSFSNSLRIKVATTVCELLASLVVFAIRLSFRANKLGEANSLESCREGLDSHQFVGQARLASAELMPAFSRIQVPVLTFQLSLAGCDLLVKANKNRPSRLNTGRSSSTSSVTWKAF
jgi:hypothetical protein